MIQPLCHLDGIQQGQLAIRFPNGTSARIRLEITAKKTIVEKQFLIAAYAESQSRFAAQNQSWAQSDGLKAHYSYVMDIAKSDRKSTKSLICAEPFSIVLQPWKSTSKITAIEEHISAIYLTTEHENHELIERIW